MLDQETLLIKKGELIIGDIDLVLGRVVETGREPLAIIMNPDRLPELRRMIDKLSGHEIESKQIGEFIEIKIFGLPVTFSPKLKIEETFIASR